MFRGALRALSASRGTSILRISILATGIGLLAAAHAVLSVAVLRPLPYPAQDRLFAVWDAADSTGSQRVPIDWTHRIAQNAGFVEVAASYAAVELNVATADSTFPLQAAFVSQELLTLLGAKPSFGTLWDPSDFAVGSAASVILSERALPLLGRPTIGDTVILAGASRQVRGVLPASFRFPDQSTLAWVPLQLPPHSGWSGQALLRLAPQSPSNPKPYLDAIVSRIQEGASVNVLPLRETFLKHTGASIWMLQAVSAGLLAITIVSAAFGFSAAAWDHRDVVALKAALGASRVRICAEYFAEAGLFAVLSAILGACIAWGVLRTAFSGWESYLHGAALTFGARTIAVAAAVSVASVSIACLPGLLVTLRTADHATLRRSSAYVGLSVVQNTLWAVQSALIFGLCVTSVWASFALRQLLRTNVGFANTDLAFMRVDTPETDMKDGRLFALRMSQLQSELSAARLSAAITNALPLSMTDQLTSVRFHDSSGRYSSSYEMTRLKVVTPEFFQVVGLRCMLGVCEPSDVGQHVVVNEAFQQKYFGRENAIVGSRIHIGGIEWSVTGVVASTTHATLFEPAAPEIFVNYRDLASLSANARRFASNRFFVVTRHNSETNELQAAASIAHRLFPGARVRPALMFSAVVRSASGYRPLLVSCGVLFGIIALLVFVSAAHSLMAREVSHRARDFAIRQALGGSPLSIGINHFKVQGIYISMACVLGAIIAWWAQRALVAKTFVPVGTSTPHPLAIAAVLTLCCGLMLLGLLGWHATRMRAFNIARMLNA